MASKRSPESESEEFFDSPLGKAVRESAQQIWLAGLGAFAKAQEEGAKAFDALVREGSEIQRKTQSAAESRLGGFADRFSQMADQMGAKAGAQWDKLESIFEQRTARALQRLGVPTQAEIADLSQRLEALSEAVKGLAERDQAGKRLRARTAKSPSRPAKTLHPPTRKRKAESSSE